MKSILLIILYLFLLSCRTKTEEALSPIHVAIDQDAVLRISTIVDHLQYIPLETTEKSVFGNIDKIVIHEDRIYVFDIKQQKSLFIFDIDGSFLSKIDSYGRGPGEYLTPTDFLINEVGEIEMLDRTLRKILVFSDKGRFIKEKKVPNNFDGFEKDFNGNYIFYNNNATYHGLKDVLYIINDKGETLNSFIPINKNYENIFRGSLVNFIKYDDDIYFTHPFDNCIYKIKDGHIDKKFYFQFGDKWMNEDFFQKNSKKEIFMIFNTGSIITKFYTINNLSSDKMYMTCRYDRKMRHIVYDVHSRKTTVYSEAVNDIDSLFSPICPSSQDKDHLIYFTYTKEILKNISKLSLRDNIWLDKLKPNDNPIIILARLR